MFYLPRLLGGKLFALAIVSLIYLGHIYKKKKPKKKKTNKQKGLIYSPYLVTTTLLVFYVSNFNHISA